MSCILSSALVLPQCSTFAPMFSGPEGTLSIFCDFCKLVVIHSAYMVSPCSFPDSGSSYDILNLVFVANSIPQNVVNDASSFSLIFRRLVMLLSALVSMA